MKKAIAVILVLCLLTTSFAGTVFAQTNSTKTPPLSMQILGKKVSTASPPIVKNNRIYLPLRTVGEALSYKAVWNAKTNTMELKLAKSAIKITIGSKTAYINSKKTAMDAAPIMYNNRAYVPLTFVQKNFNYTTTYDKVKNIISINKKTAPATGTTSGTASKGVYVLGKKMSATDLAVTKNNKVYIPLRHIGEGLGYTVTWSAAKKTMELKSKSGSVKVVVGSTNGSINGKSVKVDPAPILYNGRAYVPISFIQNNFDYEVSYDKAKNIVKVDKKAPPVVVDKPEEKPVEYKTAKIEDISYDDNGGFPQLNIVADNPIKYNSYTMANPDRMVVDIENSLLNTEFESKEIGKGGVIRVRVGQFSKAPDIVRVVIDLEDQQRCKLVQSNDKKTVSLIYANIINPVSFVTEAGRDVLMIRGSQSVEPNVFKLENPERLVVDISKSVLNEQGQTVEANSQFVKTIRSGQVDVGVARIVVDLAPGTYYDVKNEGELTKVYISNLPFSFVDYRKYYNSAFIDLSPGTEVEYQPIIDNGSRTLKIMIPKDLEVEQKTYTMNDNVMEYVTVTKETHGSQIYTVASFKMKPSVEYELLSPAVTKLVSVKFKHKATSADQLTVLIDPGHGGKDPGARAKDGTNEKDLNLDVALRLNRILRGIGFNTKMTRTDDRYVDLASRSGMANNNFVDFFMCIHFNAFMSSAKGIETLYYPNDVTDEYPIDNRKMASIFHSEITDALNRPSRGITPRPGLHVLNKTKMPAILAELGFITNPEEFAEIKKEEYRETAARALAASIVRYYKEMENIDLDVDVDAIYAAPLPSDPYSLQSVEASEQTLTGETLVTEEGEAQANTSGN